MQRRRGQRKRSTSGKVLPTPAIAPAVEPWQGHFIGTVNMDAGQYHGDAMCGTLIEIGTEVSEQLDCVPPKILVHCSWPSSPSLAVH
jgi:hypothetical protein